MSTSKLRFLPIIAVFAFLLAAQPASAETRSFAVIPFHYEIPNISTGLAEVLTAEINAGHLNAVGLETLKRHCIDLDLEIIDLGPSEDAETYKSFSGIADYLLTGEVTAFTISDKDQSVDLSDELNDLGRIVGQGSVSAHVALDLSLISTADGAQVAHWLIEGIESRNGTRMKALTYGWLGTIDVRSDEFRETMIGRATYKALGSVIFNLYGLYPVEGEVLALSGDAVVINLDEVDGLTAGDEITIVHRQVITNSQGVVAWEDDHPVGRVEVVEFQPGRCLCMIIEGTGEINEGDIAVPVVSRMTLPQFSEIPEN